MISRKPFFVLPVLLGLLICCRRQETATTDWIDQPQDQWPQIAMINEITYVDQYFPVAGCSFLLQAGSGAVAATAKHVLIYFKSDAMKSISFDTTLESWIMHPKNNPADSVVVGRLLNQDPTERIAYGSSHDDWLLFEIVEASPDIEPLRFRDKPLIEGERVYIVGWRYSDIGRPQRVYPGNIVGWEDGEVIISTEELADNTIPGLSGAPVIDSDGRLIGLMSQKSGRMERLAGIKYAQDILSEEAVGGDRRR
jgi:hypothetical protein